METENSGVSFSQDNTPMGKEVKWHLRKGFGLFLSVGYST